MRGLVGGAVSVFRRNPYQIAEQINLLAHYFDLSASGLLGTLAHHCANSI